MNQEEIKKIDEHLEKNSVSPFKDNQRATSLDLCKYWSVARPIIVFAEKYLLFWKPKWQTAINTFIGVADSICPTPPAP